MYIGPHLGQFVSSCGEVKDEFALKELLAEITPSLGFDQFALVSHVDLMKAKREAMVITSYHEGWIERSLLGNYYVDDPVHAASMRTVTAFLWSFIPTMIRLTRRQRQILEEAKPYGLAEGLTIPVQAPGEYRGSCSFGGSKAVELTVDLLGAAQLIGMFAFEAARRLQRARWLPGVEQPEVPALSQRELDCIDLVACGKTDPEIGVILGISRYTVRQYVDEAMRKYDVYKRTELVVRALFDGQICYRMLNGK
ncbi:LuxR family transcriptional regulator [Sphingobium cupriresistens]|uniref:LuxR family transcriptional regulator n=1 Tax=Sphingobium cupriresistens TaxID=1132417 RepID=UPI003BADC6F1